MPEGHLLCFLSQKTFTFSLSLPVIVDFANFTGIVFTAILA